MRLFGGCNIAGGVVTLCFSVSANAGAFQYDCEVKQSQTIEKSGATEPAPISLVGWKFSVSRESGEIAGPPGLALHRGQGWKELRVLDRGSKQQSFKFVAVSSGPYTNVLYLQVTEFQAGPLKPFLLIDNTNIHTGLCR